MGIFGSKAAYQVLMYLQNYEQGYASQISKTFGMSLSQAQNQLIKFEQLGVLISRKEGSARVYYYKRSPVGGAVVSMYSENRYQSADLDFVTTAMIEELKVVLEPLGFRHSGNPRLPVFEHPETR
jgi:predicted transcriptional regulator